ncbi:hypothetical protein ACXIHB_10055 [Tenacibaculum sp. IMCC1]|uniref:Uncharacterized protein n=1 Tax=Tenacibaculum sp. Pbs-1 TaxID=3238748 RepID=A0AB33L3U5_9FLAO
MSTTINSNKFLILDKDFVNFLKKYEVGNFQLWNMKIHFGKEVINKYQLFHLSYPSQEKYIDYANSIFYTANIKDYKWVGKDIIVSSYKDFLEKREQLRNQKLILKCHSLKINFSESSEDSIRITDTPQIVGGSGYYVSQRLKEAIEENGFTGMKFKEITELDNRLEVNY